MCVIPVACAVTVPCASTVAITRFAELNVAPPGETTIEVLAPGARTIDASEKTVTVDGLANARASLPWSCGSNATSIAARAVALYRR